MEIIKEKKKKKKKTHTHTFKQKLTTTVIYFLCEFYCAKYRIDILNLKKKTKKSIFEKLKDLHRDCIVTVLKSHCKINVFVIRYG